MLWGQPRYVAPRTRSIAHSLVEVETFRIHMYMSVLCASVSDRLSISIQYLHILCEWASAVSEVVRALTTAHRVSSLSAQQTCFKLHQFSQDRGNRWSASQELLRPPHQPIAALLAANPLHLRTNIAAARHDRLYKPPSCCTQPAVSNVILSLNLASYVPLVPSSGNHPRRPFSICPTTHSSPVAQRQ